MNLYWMITICVVCIVTLLALTIGVYGRELIELMKLVYGPKTDQIPVTQERLNNAKAHSELWNECFDLRRSISVLANNKSRVKK